MGKIEKDILNWCKELSLPKPHVVSSSLLTTSYYEHDAEDDSHTIHVRKSFDSEKLMLHELGHFFLEVHYGGAVPKAEFRKLFGNRSKVYHEEGIMILALRYLPSENWGYVSKYAESHPEEDWAETFMHVLREEEYESELDQSDTELKKKLTFVRKCIKRASD